MSNCIAKVVSPALSGQPLTVADKAFYNPERDAADKARTEALEAQVGAMATALTKLIELQTPVAAEPVVEAKAPAKATAKPKATEAKEEGAV